MPERTGAHWSRWLALALAVALADYATKAWVSAAFAPGEALDLTPFLRMTLVYNTGAAFSFLADAGGWQRWFFTLVAVVICVGIVVMLRRQPHQRLAAFALALVLGGALGNLWDRVTLGHVIDFVVVHVGEHAWPAFNLADSAITVGVALLILDSLRGHRRAPAAAQPRPEEP